MIFVLMDSQDIEIFPWRFASVDDILWEDLEMQRNFCNWLANSREILKPEDWISVQIQHFEENGASKLIQIYGNSVPQLLKTLYRELDWKRAWSFGTDKKRHRIFFDSIANSLGMKR
jgi:hypothetical protein